MKQTLVFLLGLSFFLVAIWQGFSRVDAVMKAESPFFGAQPAFSVDIGEREVCVFGETHRLGE